MSAITNPALVAPGGLQESTGPGSTQPARGAGRSTDRAKQAGGDFAKELAQAGAGEQLQFSRHALERVQRRGIELDAGTLGRLSDAVSRAAGKGSRDSLVLVDGTAFVVSVNNRTVITAVGPEHMKQSVFTNIDSAVIG